MPAHSSKDQKNIPSDKALTAPRARSLLVHGLYEKTTTKVGIAATKASYFIKNFLNKKGSFSEYSKKTFESMNSSANNKPHDSRATGAKVEGGTTNNTQNKPDKSKITSSEDNNKKEKTVSKSKSDQTEEEEKQDEVEKLQDLVDNAHEVLARATTAFPFTLFPDTIIVDRNTVSIIKKYFFLSSQVETIKVEDILKVSSGAGPILGSVSIALVMQPDNATTVKNFWRGDAIYLKKVLQGYIVALHNDVDCNKLEKDELLEMIIPLGTDTHP